MSFTTDDNPSKGSDIYVNKGKRNTWNNKTLNNPCYK